MPKNKGSYVPTKDSGHCCTLRRTTIFVSWILLIWTIGAIALFITIESALNSLWHLPVVSLEVKEDTILCNVLLATLAFQTFMNLVLLLGVYKKTKPAALAVVKMNLGTLGVLEVEANHTNGFKYPNSVLRKAKSHQYIKVWLIVAIITYAARIVFAFYVYAIDRLSSVYKINIFIVLELICIWIVFLYYRQLLENKNSAAFQQGSLKSKISFSCRVPVQCQSNELSEGNETKHVTYWDSTKMNKSGHELDDKVCLEVKMNKSDDELDDKGCLQVKVNKSDDELDDKGCLEVKVNKSDDELDDKREHRCLEVTLEVTLEQENIVEDMPPEKETRSLSLQEIKNDRQALKEWFSENYPNESYQVPTLAVQEAIVVTADPIKESQQSSACEQEITSMDQLVEIENLLTNADSKLDAEQVVLEVASEADPEHQSNISKLRHLHLEVQPNDQKRLSNSDNVLGSTVKEIVHNINTRAFEEQKDFEESTNLNKEDTVFKKSPYLKKKFLQPPLTPFAKRISKDQQKSDEPQEELFAITINPPPDETQTSDIQSQVEFIDQIELENQIDHISEQQDLQHKHAPDDNVPVLEILADEYKAVDMKPNLTDVETCNNHPPKLVAHIPKHYCSEIELKFDVYEDADCCPHNSVDSDIIYIDMNQSINPLDVKNVLPQIHHSGHNISASDELLTATESQLMNGLNTRLPDKHVTDSHETDKIINDISASNIFASENCTTDASMTSTLATETNATDEGVTGTTSTKTHATDTSASDLNSTVTNYCDTLVTNYSSKQDLPGNAKLTALESQITEPHSTETQMSPSPSENVTDNQTPFHIQSITVFANQTTGERTTKTNENANSGSGPISDHKEVVTESHISELCPTETAVPNIFSSDDSITDTSMTGIVATDTNATDTGMTSTTSTETHATHTFASDLNATDSLITNNRSQQDISGPEKLTALESQITEPPSTETHASPSPSEQIIIENQTTFHVKQITALPHQTTCEPIQTHENFKSCNSRPISDHEEVVNESRSSELSSNDTAVALDLREQDVAGNKSPTKDSVLLTTAPSHHSDNHSRETISGHEENILQVSEYSLNIQYNATELLLEPHQQLMTEDPTINEECCLKQMIMSHHHDPDSESTTKQNTNDINKDLIKHQKRVEGMRKRSISNVN